MQVHTRPETPRDNVPRHPLRHAGTQRPRDPRAKRPHSPSVACWYALLRRPFRLQVQVLSTPIWPICGMPIFLNTSNIKRNMSGIPFYSLQVTSTQDEFRQKPVASKPTGSKLGPSTPILLEFPVWQTVIGRHERVRSTDGQTSASQVLDPSTCRTGWQRCTAPYLILSIPPVLHFHHPGSVIDLKVDRGRCVMHADNLSHNRYLQPKRARSSIHALCKEAFLSHNANSTNLTIPWQLKPLLFAC